MKKRILGLSLLCLILLMGLMGCKKNQEETHTKHNFGEWEVTRKASCALPGIETRTCECGEKEKRELEKLPHTEVTDEAVTPTCTEAGKTEGSHCSVCNTVIIKQEVLPPAHQEVTLKAVAVTCTRAGKSAGSKCALCGEIVTRQKKIRATGHNYEGDACTKCGKHLPDTAVALVVDNFNENGPANFVTKEAYPGGTTLTFNVYLPKVAKPDGSPVWWGIGWTTNPEKACIYDWSEDGSGILLNAKNGEWQEVSMTVPADGKNYYLFFLGAKGEWNGEPIYVDDVTITDKNGKVIGTDNFDYGIDAGLFNVEKINKDSGMAAAYEYERCAEHKAVEDKAVASTCDTAGKKAGTHCSECGKVLVKQEEIPALGHKWNDNDICTTCGKEREDLVAVLVVDKVSEMAPMNFITEEAYPGGSTINFSAFAPKFMKADGNDYTWWGICWTTDPTDVSLYNCFDASKGSAYKTEFGVWKDYTVTLPNDNNEYYIYFVGAKGEWQGKELEINDFIITSSAGKVLAEESFDNGVENGIFDVVGKDVNSGETVVYDRVFELPCSNGHTVVTLPGTAPDCTNPGITEGSYCSVCGATLVAQETIPATGHKYDENTGFCACGEQMMDRAVAINIDALNEESPMNFITRAAYAGGSTISFSAYVPVSNWWAISYTKNPADVSLYKWTEGYGAAQPSTVGEWKEYSLTLPDDGETYYFYIVGAKGEWGGKELLIDNVKITNKAGEPVATDDFNYGMHSGIFNITELGYTSSGETVAVSEEILGEVCMHPESKWHKDNDIEATCTDTGIIGATRCECGEVMIPEEVVPALGHNFVDGECSVCHEKEVNKAAAITINKMGADDGKMSFITKEAYAAGSTVEFDILIPENLSSSWWGIGYATSTSAAGLYNHSSAAMSLPVTIGEWSKCSFTLPEGDGSYYIYLLAAVGEWPKPAAGVEDTVFLIDNFVVKNGSEIASENFNGGFENSLFTVNPNGEEAVSLYTFPEEGETNHAAAITINKMGSDDGKMSFITKDAYAAGSTVEFDILIPENLSGSWWGIGYATSTSAASLYNHSSAAMSLPITIGEWSKCSFTLPEGDGSYYIYLLAAVGEWPKPAANAADTVFLIDNFVVKNGSEIATEDFNDGFENSLFTVNPNGEEAVSLYTFPEEGETNQAAAITINKMGSDDGKMSFITKDAYAAGSTVEFDILIPENLSGSWWGIGYATSTSSASLYNHSSAAMSLPVTIGEWSKCSFTLPEGDGSYYIYLLAAVGEWPKPAANAADTVFLIDNFVVKNGSEIATEDFNDGFENSLFTVNPNGEEAVSLYTFPEEGETNHAAAITINKMGSDDGKMSFITKEAYAAGSTVEFDILIPENLSSSWWGIGYATSTSAAGLYNHSSAAMSLPVTIGEWSKCSFTLPEGDGSYYIYLLAAVGEWPKPAANAADTVFLIDNFVVKNGSEIATEDFNDGFENSLFTVNPNGEAAVSLSEVK